MFVGEISTGCDRGAGRRGSGRPSDPSNSVLLWWMARLCRGCAAALPGHCDALLALLKPDRGFSWI